MPAVDQPAAPRGDDHEDARPAPAATELPPYPGAAKADRFEDDWDDDRPPFGLWGLVGVVVVAVVALVGAYSIGYSRGSAGLEEGTSPTTSLVETPEGPPAPPIDPSSLTPLVVPTEGTVTVDLTNGLPGEVDGRLVSTRGDWEPADGAVRAAQSNPLPPDATEPRPMGAGSDVVIDTGKPVELATVALTDPTPLSGVVFRYQDDNNYWAALIDPQMEHISLYLMKDGTMTSEAFINLTTGSVATFGLVAVGDQVSLVLDGEGMVLDTFFGPKASLPDADIAGHGVGLLAGGGNPAFANLVFG